MRKKTLQPAGKMRKRQKRLDQIAGLCKIGLFGLAIAVFAVLGLLIPIRPTTSEMEKRQLTAFPAFQLESFLNGEFFKNVGLWYADTFPMRDQFLAANNALEELYGLQQRQIITGRKAEQNQSQEKLPEQAAEQSAADGSITEGQPEVIGDVYITEGRAFELFYFSEEYTDRYCEVINRTQERLGDKVHIYCLPAPVNSGIILSEDMQERVDSSNQKQAIEYLASKLDSRVTTIDVYDTLRSHNSEYIYFNTDHHWTALGAYYAYQEFANAKGVPANSLDVFTSNSYEGFLGTFYSSSQSEELKNNPDTVVTYTPLGTNNLMLTDQNGISVTKEIVSSADDLSAGSKYMCFIGGDQPYAHIMNPQIQDGSSIAVFKESYANCFIPFLVDHYADIYIIDYRYYQNDFVSLIQENHIQDVLFLNNLSAINEVLRLEEMEALVP